MYSLLGITFCVFAAGYEPPVDWQPRTPHFDEELVPGFERLSAAVEAEAETEPANPMFAEELVRKHIVELEEEVGRNELLSSLMQSLLVSEAPTEVSREVRILMSMGLRLLLAEIDASTLVRMVAPYWPPANESINAESIEANLQSVTLSDDPSEYFVDFTVFIDLLRDEWAVGSSELDGLVDYMYERQAIMAWLAMLRLDGVDEEEKDEVYERLSEVLHPYNDYYRTRPDRLPPGTREGLHELLIEFTQGDSLWARVFVAEILSKVPYMRDPEIEAALRDDPHWLIQRRMAYLDEAEAEAEQE